MEKKEVIELVKACMEACLERYAVPGMMSVEDTAERLGISKDTVRDYIRKGELVGYEIGNRMMRVSVQSINDLLERVKTKGMREEAGERREADPASPDGSAVTSAAAEPEVKQEEPKAEPEVKQEEPKAEPEVKQEEPKAEPEVKQEESKAEQCAAIHPKSGKRCVLPAGHEGKHRCE